MRVSLQAAPRPALPMPPPAPLLDPAGPSTVLGGQTSELPVPVTPSRTSLFGPRGVCLAGPDRPFWVADTGHHRLLGWRRPPSADGTPADWLIGQPAFGREGRNGQGPANAASLNVPTGIARCGRGLAVADAWNHRVLIWQDLPQASHQPADLVLGQAGFGEVLANRGQAEAGADTLNWCYGVHAEGDRIYVADTGNRRVLIWDRLPVVNGQSADAVLGQAGFASHDENGGAAPAAGSLRWPHQIALIGGWLAVADAGNNRLLLWRSPRPASNQPADLILGQADAAATEHNRSRYWPDAAALNMPYGVAAAGGRLIVADTANSRLLGWRVEELATGAAASLLTGQPDFAAKGDNRWQAVARDSLCWPYAVAVADGLVAIADSGNNRILLWRLAS